jgi:diadenosine tetraphosphatase ApaH/serine/threonine PP2A family protein phosphatase
MKLWELRSYEQVIKLEQERLVYQARLRSRFGRAWRRKAPVESLMPLRLARYGVPLAETAPAGLAAAGIEPALLPPAPRPAEIPAVAAGSRATGAAPLDGQRREVDHRPDAGQPAHGPEPEPEPEADQSPWFETPRQIAYQGGYDPTYDPSEQYARWYEEQQQADEYRAQFEEEPPAQEPSPEETGTFPIPVGPNRTRELGEGGGTPVVEPDEESYYQVFKQSISGSGYPTPREFSSNIEATYGVPVMDAEAKRMVLRFQNRHTAELEDDHIA